MEDSTVFKEGFLVPRITISTQVERVLLEIISFNSMHLRLCFHKLLLFLGVPSSEKSLAKINT